MLTNFDRRKFRIRNAIAKNNKLSRPRISVFRSNKNIYAQLITVEGVVVKSFSTLNLDEDSKLSGIEKAKLVGKKFSKSCLESSIKDVVFDKGAYKYNGRVKALAEACREAGLNF